MWNGKQILFWFHVCKNTSGSKGIAPGRWAVRRNFFGPSPPWKALRFAWDGVKGLDYKSLYDSPCQLLFSGLDVDDCVVSLLDLFVLDVTMVRGWWLQGMWCFWLLLLLLAILADISQIWVLGLGGHMGWFIHICDSYSCFAGPRGMLATFQKGSKKAWICLKIYTFSLQTCRNNLQKSSNRSTKLVVNDTCIYLIFILDIVDT